MSTYHCCLETLLFVRQDEFILSGQQAGKPPVLKIVLKAPFAGFLPQSPGTSHGLGFTSHLEGPASINLGISLLAGACVACAVFP